MIGVGRRPVRRRVDVGLLRDRDGDAQRVVDDAAVGLLAAGEARQDREAGGVGGGPALGAQRVRLQVPDRAAVGVPARALALGGEQLEELAVALAQRQHVAVAAALDRRVERCRVGAGIGLVGDLEAHRHERLGERDVDVGDAVGAVAAEVRPQRHRAERADVVVGGVDRAPARRRCSRRCRWGRSDSCRSSGCRRTRCPALRHRRPRARARRRSPRPHRHAADLRAALPPARAHGVAVARRRLHTPVGEPLPVALQLHAPARPAHDVAGLAARAVLPGEPNPGRIGLRLQLRDRAQARLGRCRDQEGEREGCEEGSHEESVGAGGRFT